MATNPKEASTAARAQLNDQRTRLSGVRVLVADRDVRTAALVQRVLFSFGFAKIELVSSGNAALEKLRNEEFDLIITEWNMPPANGITLVKIIRQAKEEKLLRRDIPIIMLTARADKDAVQQARDAGITEFLVKPFSAKTLSHRLIQVIDNPRAFVDAPGYTGPCRRRREPAPPETGERRGDRKARLQTPAEANMVQQPNFTLRNQIGRSAEDILNDEIIAQAQDDLLKGETEFLTWAKDDIGSLEKAYRALVLRPTSEAHQQLLAAAYSIKSQAGIFGYDLGTEVAGMLVDYLTAQKVLDVNKLTVVRKHIDTIVVIFNQKIKETGRSIGQDLLSSLHKLIAKLS